MAGYRHIWNSNVIASPRVSDHAYADEVMNASERYEVKLLCSILQPSCKIAWKTSRNLDFALPLQPVQWHRRLSRSAHPRSLIIPCRVMLWLGYWCPLALGFQNRHNCDGLNHIRLSHITMSYSAPLQQRRCRTKFITSTDLNFNVSSVIGAVGSDELLNDTFTSYGFYVNEIVINSSVRFRSCTGGSWQHYKVGLMIAQPPKVDSQRMVAFGSVLQLATTECS